MIITDKEAIKELKKTRSSELYCRIENFPDDEIEGRSDMQMVIDELSYLISNFTEEGHSLCEDLQEAKKILRETKNGKTIPLWKDSLKPVYTQSRIQSCRDTINEFNRLKSMLKRLNKMGLVGKYEGWI